MSWDKWTTTPTPTQAHAFIGVGPQLGHTFRFNPDQVAWDYQENIFSQDTLGGRVVQLLSVGLNAITIQGRAGNRGELQRLAKNIKEIMNYQVRTLNPVDFKVPSRNWNFKVYIQAMPQVSWDVAATSYPYQLNLLVDEDLTGVKTREINSEVLQRLASGIGHDSSQEIHGGDAAGFAEIVEIVTSFQPVGAAIEEGVSTVAGALGVAPDGFTFPLQTTQGQVKGKGWCYDKTVSCHHDYKAADIMVDTGTPVVAAVAGKVTSATDNDGSSTGSRVQIMGSDSTLYYYTHMGDGTIQVRSGQNVEAGQQIGLVGTAEDAMGTVPHLHFDAGNWSARPSCSGADCSNLPFIDVQPWLAEAFKYLPQ